ncbi:type IV pilus biogenesis/stability protein PilW [Ferrigenium sp. UT5]|uniref:type IV pilus biogenesis/stability protein PilW n=1 Tax=Ferrigenium sp. UT5 TaxID=3242105 RepID=UPI0038B2E3E2
MKSGMVLFIFLLAGCATHGATDERDRNIAASHTELAASYFERGQYSIALQELGVALQADDSYAPAYNVRGLVRMTLREDKQAEADFRRSLKLEPANAGAYNNYGWFLCQRGRAKESLQQFRKALANPLYGTPDLANANAGICAYKAGDPALAETYLQRALILHPEMPEALAGLAALAYGNGNPAAAKSWLLRYLRTGRELDAEQLLLAVRIERQLGDRNASASFALQLRKRFPDSPEAQLLQSGE